MYHKQFAALIPLILLISLILSACFHPPYNHFKPYRHLTRDAATGAAVGSVAGFVAGSTLVGTGIGAALFTARGVYKDSKQSIIYDLQKKGDIRFEQYGGYMTLIIPTDRYFLFNSPQLNELCYFSLYKVAQLLRQYSRCTIYIAGFTDNIGSKHHKKMLTQARAEAMLTFLWANGIPAKLLEAQGYEDKHDVSDNKLIHGSAHNRRLEIQWSADCPRCCKEPIPYLGPTK